MEQATQKVIDFVINNKVKARKGFICVDGRYKAGYETAGMLARPGGNFRGIMVLLALKKKLGLTVGQIVDRAVEAVEKMGISFNMHTDEHADPEDLFSIGCGHIAKAADPKTSKAYKVDPKDIKKALVYLRIKLEGKKYYQMIKLSGEHQEKGVLVITGTKYTVNHYDPKRGMYFVFDQARDDVFLKQLYDNLHISKISFKEFKDYSDLQLQATLDNLAKGLPIYEVNADLSEPEVKFIGKVE
jgi:hypothetical protein